jgi:HSP20 family molecular chaperone IbpA
VHESWRIFEIRVLHKELLIDEWSVGVYHHELELPTAINGELANVTYGNWVLTVASTEEMPEPPAPVP